MFNSLSTVSSNDAIVFMIYICVAFLIVMLLIKPLKLTMKFIIRSVLSMSFIYLLNFMLVPYGFSAGMNLLNAFIVGFLGIPGVVLLFVSNFIL